MRKTVRLPNNLVCLCPNCIPLSRTAAEYILGENIEVTLSFDVGTEAIKLGGSSEVTFDLTHNNGHDAETKQVLSFVRLRVLC